MFFLNCFIDFSNLLVSQYIQPSMFNITYYSKFAFKDNYCWRFVADTKKGDLQPTIVRTCVYLY